MMILELPLNNFFSTDINKEVCGVLESSIYFKKRFDKKKSHNMLSLMLNPRVKNLRLISFFIGCEKGVNIIK
jgi:hypothetical protein